MPIKTFVGTSANTLHIQIWTALIALLIVKYLKVTTRFSWSCANLIALLRMNLFAYRDVWVWLNDPFASPPLPPEPEQGALALLSESFASSCNSSPDWIGSLLDS